ncbi:MAG TPA: hypothetical protein VGO53_16165 [Steroidobacteraceae bacterium]|jgi:hypothetical protein|nr:hypothetical protein [Steroidobacteraceae bacterium]
MHRQELIAARKAERIAYLATREAPRAERYGRTYGEWLETIARLQRAEGNALAHGQWV